MSKKASSEKRWVGFQRLELSFDEAVNALVALEERRHGLQARIRACRANDLFYENAMNIDEFHVLIAAVSSSSGYGSAVSGALAILKALDEGLSMKCQHAGCTKLRSFRNARLHRLRYPLPRYSEHAFVDKVLLETVYFLDGKLQPLETHLNQWITCLSEQMTKRRSKERHKESLDEAPEHVKRSVAEMQRRNACLPSIQTHGELVDAGKTLQRLQQETIGWHVHIQGSGPSRVSILIPRQKRILPPEPTTKSINRNG